MEDKLPDSQAKIVVLYPRHLTYYAASDPAQAPFHRNLKCKSL